MPNEVPKNILEELQELNNSYATAYWDIFENKEAVSAEQQARMREELLKHYIRTVALLDGKAGLDKDSDISDLEKSRLLIKEETRLHEEEIKSEYRLKQAKLTAQTDFKSAIIKKEFEIKKKAEEKTLEIKGERLIPIKEPLPQRWWERLFRRPIKFRTNYAYELASQKADLEAAIILSEREDEILKLEAQQSGMDELELAVMKVMDEYTGGKKRGRKARILNEAFSEIIGPICETFARRERALTELIDSLCSNDNNAFNEPSERAEDADVLNNEFEREELQSRAVTLLTAFCHKRMDELNQGPKKPKRQRVRKTRPRQDDREQSDD